jgi:hypothetical protein
MTCANLKFSINILHFAIILVAAVGRARMRAAYVEKQLISPVLIVPALTPCPSPSTTQWSGRGENFRTRDQTTNVQDSG